MKLKQKRSQMDGSLLDLSDRSLTKLEIPGGDRTTAVIADRNSITRIENLEEYPNIRQLSLKSNRLVHMNGVCKLHHLTVLNLPQNSIIAIEGLRELTDLTWLNLSGNSIKVMENLSNNVNLKHLDLSDNNIAQLGDIHHLSNLKTLLLHGNAISTLKMIPHFLSNSISIFSLAENEIIDINEVSYLAYLQNLVQVSIMNNPCVLMSSSMPVFDYRPFVVNWCPRLEILDGEMISNKERLKAEWMYSQGKGHHYRVGQHVETVQYLSSVCPLATSIERRGKKGKAKSKSLLTRLESAEDAKLSQILYKQKVHQQQLQEQRKSTQHWNIPSKLSPQGGDNSNITEAGSPGHTTGSRQPVRAWSVHGDTSVSSSHSLHHGQQMNDLSVQDVNSEDYDKKSTSSLLDSESTYLPVENVKSANRPMTAPSVSMLSAPVTQNILDIITRGENRPATAIGDNKYDAYDRRPIKPLNQEMYKGIFKPDFNVSQPQQSGTGPAVGAKKKVPPTAQAVDYDTSQDASQMEELLKKEKPTKDNVENIPTEELSSIRNVALKKSRSNSHRSKTEDNKSARGNNKRKDRNDHSSHTHSGNKTSIPVAKSSVSRTQSEYVPGRYSTTHRAAKSESSKSRNVKTISEKVIHNKRLNGLQTDRRDTQNESLGDSGFISRPNSDAVLVEDVRAATKIQSFWRGYYTREYDVDAVRVRREIRARRAEDHIVVLRTELDKQRKLYEQEKQLRTLQLEAIRHLWKEVQSLQNWKNEVLQSQTFISPETKREHEYNSYNSSLEIQNTLARAEMLNRMGESMATTTHSSQYTMDGRKQQELEKTCSSLQSQVSQLQSALNTVSSLVLQSTGGSMQGLMSQTTPRPETSLDINTNTNKSEEIEDILVTGEFDEIEISEYDSIYDSHWGTVPHSLSPYPSEEEETYFKTVPHPGFPTPPKGLRLENRGKNALVLRWQPSKVLNGEGKEMNKPLLGYRVFVNDKPKAMIAATKQKALIEGLDPTLTYKIYVKAVSDLGESNTSDVVMAALSKGSRRRSSSSDSNRSYDSDRESTSSELRTPHRKDSRKNRKTKSPHPSKSEKMDRKESSLQDSGAMERPPSKLELEAEGIMTQPKLHTHRRTRSKDYQNKLNEDMSNLKPKQTPSSPTQRAQKLSSQESQGFSFDERNKHENISDSQQNLSSTFTIDSQSSLLVAMSKNLDPDVSDSKDSGKGHRRRRSKDYKTEQRGDVSDSSSSVSSVAIMMGDRSQSGRDSPSVRGREDPDSGSFNRGDSRRGSNVKISPTAGSQGVPVIDGRRRHGSGSRPSSPAHSDISETRTSTQTGDRRRMPIADLLEQRFSGRVSQSAGSAASSTTTLTQSQADASSASDLPPPIPRREGKYSSLENLSSRASQDCNRSPTDRYSPTSSERKRTSSTCSESDIVTGGSPAARQLDMDKKNTNSNSGGIVAKLLQKLQTFSKAQEDSLKVNKIKRKSGDPEDMPRKASGDSDCSDVVAPAPVHSDSSGAHSDDSQQVKRPSHRTHRRTSSDHRGILVKLTDQRPPSPSHKSDHSPVIRDSSKTSSSSNNIKRHASFHGILPSKKEDLVRSGSTENLNEKGTSSNKQQNIDITVPTTPTRKTRPRSRSRSPSGSSSHVPIISAAQLQKQSRASSTPPT